jgi:hypothetical protein
MVISQDRRCQHLLVYINNFSDTSSWFLFFKLSPTRALLRQKPKGGIELSTSRTVEGCRRKMVLSFSSLMFYFPFL